MGSDGMPKTVWVWQYRGWKESDVRRDGPNGVDDPEHESEAEYRLLDDSLRRALELAEAVEWIEARAEVNATRTWSPSKGARWLVVHNAKQRSSDYHDDLLEAVSALKAKLGEKED